LAAEAAAETLIVAPAEKVFLMSVRGKADFRMIAQDQAVFQKIAREKADFHTIVPGPVKADSRMTAPGKEALAQSAPLTGNQAQVPGDSVTATNLFSGTGKVPVLNEKVTSLFLPFSESNVFWGNFSHNCTDISANRRS